MRVFTATASAPRPAPPPLRRVFKFAGLPQRQLALDLGCGSGQVAAVLARSFARVVGVDPSEAQLAHAEQLPNIEYVAAPAEHVPQLADGCADLITVAQAFHWCVHHVCMCRAAVSQSYSLPPPGRCRATYARSYISRPSAVGAVQYS